MVAPEFRGRRMLARVKSLKYVDSVRAGYTREFGIVEIANLSAMRGQSKDSRFVGRISFVRSFGLTLIRIDGTSRWGWWTARRRLEVPVTALAGEAGGAD